MFAWWGQFVYRHRWAVLGVSGVMLAGSIVALFNGGTLKNSGGRDTESGRALALMQDQPPEWRRLVIRARLWQQLTGGQRSQLQAGDAHRAAAVESGFSREDGRNPL